MKRMDVIYLALQTIKAQQIIDELGTGLLFPAARNGKVQELARLVDAALAKEVERRQSGRRTE